MLKMKIYAPDEERLNVISHAVGAALTPIGLLLLLFFAKGSLAGFACTLYALSMLTMFLGSSCYHAAKTPRSRLMLRRLDHAAIYLLIAGTYTPLMLIGCPGREGFGVLALVWLIALVGMNLELLGIKPFKGFSIILYLLSGWLCISIFPVLIRSLSPWGLGLLIAGGVVYSLGVVYYVRRVRYSHAIWHFFVIGGVLLHYGAILTLVLPHGA